MRTNYRAWLEAEGYSANTINTQCSYASRAEAAYGDLDALYDEDRLEGVLSTLRYSTADQRRGAPNPAKVLVAGDLYKSLASFRAATGLYRRFRDAAMAAPVLLDGYSRSEVQSTADTEVRERIGLERDLQRSLRRDLQQLEAGLTITDEGVERSVSSGYIDITARDAAGATVVIELKAGLADRGAVGQILSYMGDVAEEEPDTTIRGIIVAAAFHKGAQSAARAVPNLSLKAYSVRFQFADPECRA